MIRWIWAIVIGGHWHSYEYLCPHFTSDEMGQLLECSTCKRRKYVPIVKRNEPVLVERYEEGLGKVGNR